MTQGEVFCNKELIHHPFILISTVDRGRRGRARLATWVLFSLALLQWVQLVGEKHYTNALQPIACAAADRLVRHSSV